LALGLLGVVAFRLAVHPTESPSPALSPRAPRVYREKLDGPRYVNQDLGLALVAPEGWTPSIGKREETLPPYEGLVLKVESRGAPDPETKFRPLVSVFKKTLAAGAAPDPLVYIRRELLGPPKTVIEPPKMATVSGRTVGSVSYDMPTAGGTLRVRQLVRIQGTQAIIVTAFVPVRSTPSCAADVERIFGSIDWSS
jgi:hypothetical protein